MPRASRPRLLGIAGASCSGKTVLANWLAERLEGQGTAVLAMDAYYRDLSHVAEPERASHNFDAPEAFDWDLLRAHLTALSEGRPVGMPVYDFATHTRTLQTHPLVPGRFVVFEGLLALHDAAVRRLLSTTVFVRADNAVCLARRIERDMRERSRTRESVERQYRETVLPMARKWVLPQETHASVIVDGRRPLAVSGRAVLARLGVTEPAR